MFILIHAMSASLFPDPDPSSIAWTGPPTEIITIQSLLYASLTTSLFAAFLAMLGKQWVNHIWNRGGSTTDKSREVVSVPSRSLESPHTPSSNPLQLSTKTAPIRNHLPLSSERRSDTWRTVAPSYSRLSVLDRLSGGKHLWPFVQTENSHHRPVPIPSPLNP